MLAVALVLSLPNAVLAELTWYGTDGKNSWQRSKEICIERNERLCTRSELCPSGQVQGGRRSGDAWVPVKDENNKWIQVGNGHWPACVSHEELSGGIYGYPHWGPTTDTYNFRKHLACCSDALTGRKSEERKRTVVPEWVRETDKIILPEVTDGDRRRGPDPDKAICKVQRKMDCKEGCPSGWELIKTSDYGCCSSWTSCGGNRKTCQYEYNCPPDLRGTARDPNNEMRRIPQSDEDVDEVSASVIPEMVMDTEVSDGDRRRRPPVAWPQPVCKVRRKMDCKQGCPSGWEHVRTTDHGCCASFGDCFGNRKICQKEVKCPSRRRAGAEGTLNNAE